MSAEPTSPHDDPASTEPSDGSGNGAGLDIKVEVEPSEHGSTDGLIGAPPDGTSANERSTNDLLLAQLKASLAKAEQDKKDNYDKFLRAAADLENHRRRAKRDLDDARAESKTRVLKEMLPVVDNLERALQHAEEAAKGGTGDVPAILDGVRLVLRQFTHAFERCDVTAVEAQGQPFDPNLHEAISQQETNDNPPGTVTQVLQRGYKLGERLLRPALVVVARALLKPAEPTAPAEPEPEPQA